MTTLHAGAPAVDDPVASVLVLLGEFDRAADPPDPLHGLVRRFRDGDVAAWAEVLDRTVLRPVLLPPTGRHTAIVAVPGHAGESTAAVAALRDALAQRLGWIGLPAGSLVRTKAVPAAKHSGNRDAIVDAASLRWQPGRLAARVGTIVLLDDVLRSGGTLRACIAAMRRDGWQGDIRAVVVARAR